MDRSGGDVKAEPSAGPPKDEEEVAAATEARADSLCVKEATIRWVYLVGGSLTRVVLNPI